MIGTTYAGVDYGGGKTNIDLHTGIRFGVIHQNDVGAAWYEDAVAIYGDPTCPKCGRETEFTDDKVRNVLPDGPGEYWCERCQSNFDSDDAFPDEPKSYTYDKDGYVAMCGDSGDIFIMKSPYYTNSQFCSPCAPGAGSLMNPCHDGPKTYCFGIEWFIENKAPYDIYLVSTNELIFKAY